MRIVLADYDPAWPAIFRTEADRVRAVLGDRAVDLWHAGSTSVRGLPAKAIIDMVLALPDSSDDAAYVPDLEAAGYVLRIREPHWFEHRVFKGPQADINLHVFTAGCSEIQRMLVFRDWLRANPADRDLYAATKRELAKHEWGRVQDYADRKSQIVYEILVRAGWTDAVEVRPEPLASPASQELIEALNAELSARYPEQGANHFILDAQEVSDGNGIFLVAYVRSEPVGCGALRRIEPGTGELKRMYVRPEFRRRGVSKAVLEALEAHARALGLLRLVLETGQRQAEALVLYAKAGFKAIPAFGEYVVSPLSVCMEKVLEQPAGSQANPRPARST